MLGERLDRRRLTGIAMTLAGALVVIWDPRGFAVSGGLLFAVAASVASSFGAVMLKQVEGIKPLQFQAWVGLASLVPVLALSLLSEPGGFAAARAAGWPFVAAVLFSGLLVSVLAHTLYYGLIQRHEATLISPLTLMTPLFTIALGVLLTHDSFDGRMALGAILALAGVLIIALRPTQLLALAIRLRPK
jgi:drug/metabolite transporter (DMT)-like permease